MFYSNERIIARCDANNVRHPKYPREVNLALQSNTLNIGLVRFRNKIGSLSSEKLIDNQKTSPFFIYPKPTKAELISSKFEFN